MSKSLKRKLLASLDRDLAVTLSQFTKKSNYATALLVDCDSYGDYVRKLRNFVICPIHPNIELDSYMVIASSMVKGRHTLPIEYGTLSNVVGILRNHIGEVEGLQVGFMVIGIEPLHMLDQKLIEESLSHIN